MRRTDIVIATLAVPVAFVIGMALMLGACGDDGSGGSTPTPTVTVTVTPPVEPTEEPGATMTVSIYLMRGESLGVAHRAVPASGAPATAAMNELLAGPNARERAARLSTTIPDGSTLNGLIIEDGVARVDLSPAFASGGGSLSMQARVAQVVFTLTQFRTVKAVDFLLDGEAVETLGGEGLMLDPGQHRRDWADLLPAIFVESPAVGDVIASPLAGPLLVQGSAMVFEATFVAEVLDADGAVLARKTVTATRGAPTRGTFKIGVPFTTPSAPRGALRVYEESMEDGSRLNVVTIPLRFLASD